MQLVTFPKLPRKELLTLEVFLFSRMRSSGKHAKILQFWTTGSDVIPEVVRVRKFLHKFSIAAIQTGLSAKLETLPEV